MPAKSMLLQKKRSSWSQRDSAAADQLVHGPEEERSKKLIHIEIRPETRHYDTHLPGVQHLLPLNGAKVSIGGTLEGEEHPICFTTWT